MVNLGEFAVNLGGKFAEENLEKVLDIVKWWWYLIKAVAWDEMKQLEKRWKKLLTLINECDNI